MKKFSDLKLSTQPANANPYWTDDAMAIRALLQEREEKIAKLTKENKKLRAMIRNMKESKH